MSVGKNTYEIILLPDKAAVEMSMLRKVRLINIFDILQDIDQIKNIYDGSNERCLNQKKTDSADDDTRTIQFSDSYFLPISNSKAVMTPIVVHKI